MADFVAVLRKTIGTLGENTPEMREKVFEKARAAIESKLAAIQPPPPNAVADRQRMALEDAITAVKAEYGEEPLTDDEDDFESAFASQLDDEPSIGAAGGTSHGGRDFGPDADVSDDEDDFAVGAPLAGAPPPRPVKAARRSARGRTGLLAAALALVVIGGAGYAIWLNKDDFASLLGGSGPTVVTEAEQTAAEEEIAAQDEATETALAEDTAPAEAPVEAPVQEKFTQRLLPDGSEIDEGPAAEERRIGEGTSVTAVSPGTEPESAEAEGTQTAEGQQQATPAQVPVGQRAIFYEERTSAAEGSAQTGSIVWSLVQESPGGNEPPEPAIRAEATIPAHNLQLRMTIRRNADQTLPASHIIEMIFLTPDNFAGGAIDNVLRIAMKDTEEATGNPLLGIPAKIADGFFLVALSDQPAETEANLTLLRRQDWIDVPVVYRSGRRALMTIEKGIPGDRVFQEALQAWQEATSG